MSPKLYQYRIVYTVGSREYEWTRSGVSLARVKELARRALELMYSGGATLKSVERIAGSALS